MFIPSIFALKITQEQEFLHWLQTSMRLISSCFYKERRSSMTTNDKKSNKYFSDISLYIDFSKCQLWFERKQYLNKNNLSF